MNKINLAKYLKTSLGLLLFLLPWQTILITKEQFLNGVKWEYGTIGFFATEILLWVCAFLFIAWYVKKVRLEIGNWKLKFRWSKDRLFVASCLLFIIYSFLSIVWAGDRQVAYSQAFHILEAFLLFFMLYIGPLSFRDAAKWFVVGAVVQSVLGVWQFVTQSTIALKWLGLVLHPVQEAGTSIISSPEIGRWLRAYGGFSHPNIFGGYLVVSIVFTLFILLDTENCEVEKKYSFWKKHILYHIALIIQCSALFFTFSRSAWAAFLWGFLAYLIYVLRRNSRSTMHGLSHVLSVLILFVVLWGMFSPLLSTRFGHESQHEIQSTTERVSGYVEAFNIFKQNPWFGIGAGNYTMAAYELNPSRPGWEYQPVHNVPLLLLVELGIVGILLLVVIVFVFLRFYFWDAWKHFDLMKSLEEKYFKKLTFLFTFFIVILLLSLLDHYLFSSYVGLLLSVVYLAIIMRFLQTKKHS